MSPSPRILVTGASGNVGAPLVEHLPRPGPISMHQFIQDHKACWM